MAIIIARARRSTDPYVRGQLWVIPLLSTILLAEVCETFIWLDPNLISVRSRSVSNTCTPYNTFLTYLLWIFLFPTQPYFVILPCRRIPSGDSTNNRDLLKIPEYLALTFIVYFWSTMAMHNRFIYNTSDLLHPREDLQAHGYQLFSNTETCSYLGRFGHLFWTLNTTESFFSPNAACYVILMTVVFYTSTQTWRFLVWCILFNAFIITGMCFTFQGSVEIASVWCWTGISFHTYLLFQPYLLPCRLEDTVTAADAAAASNEYEVVALTSQSRAPASFLQGKDPEL